MEFIPQYSKREHCYCENELFLYNVKTYENYFTESDLKLYILYATLEKNIRFRYFTINKKNEVSESIDNNMNNKDNIYCYQVTSYEFSLHEPGRQIINEFLLFYKIYDLYSINEDMKYNLCQYIGSCTNTKISLLALDRISNLKREMCNMIKEKNYQNLEEDKQVIMIRKDSTNFKKFIFVGFMIGTIGIILGNSMWFNKK